MAIRAGQFVLTGGGASDGSWFIIDRIQTANINPNITTEQINEVGNEKAVAIIRDAPAALTFEVESYDVLPKMEALLQNIPPTSITNGQQLDFNGQLPFNLLAPIRSSLNLFTIAGGVICPSLSLSQVTYRYGLKQDAQQTFTLQGDAMYYGPAGTVPYEDIFTANGTTTTWTTAHAPVAYVNPALGTTQYILNVQVYSPDGETATRYFNGAQFDYTDTSGGIITLTTTATVPVNNSMIRVQYFSTAAETLPQSDNTADGISIKPAALRAWNIDVYYGSSAATPVWTFLPYVQSVDLTWAAQGFDANDEFGNPNSLSHDYTVPAVTGTITTRPESVAAMQAQLSELLNVNNAQVVGMLSSTAVPLLIVLNCPNGVAGVAAGTPLKTLYIPDAIFDPPDMQARAAGKIELPFKFYSNTGTLYTYQGFAGNLSFGYTEGQTADVSWEAP